MRGQNPIPNPQVRSQFFVPNSSPFLAGRLFAGIVLVWRLVRVLVGLQDQAAALPNAGLSGTGVAGGLLDRPLVGREEWSQSPLGGRGTPGFR